MSMVVIELLGILDKLSLGTTIQYLTLRIFKKYVHVSGQSKKLPSLKTRECDITRKKTINCNVK
ncbi:hypothetical protein DPMN_162492 [Dreissena polymorpha]|uniref:Uncharacterized protein n=1 Tax=Dreissena polymorpha TaxID=45954 RepID=A0A9D4IS19_DREPO|nr:hypothetical protein DPMN_162492 [Dreissena polymorpha]